MATKSCGKPDPSNPDNSEMNCTFTYKHNCACSWEVTQALTHYSAARAALEKAYTVDKVQENVLKDHSQLPSSYSQFGMSDIASDELHSCLRSTCCCDTIQTPSPFAT